MNYRYIFVLGLNDPQPELNYTYWYRDVNIDVTRPAMRNGHDIIFIEMILPKLRADQHISFIPDRLGIPGCWKLYTIIAIAV